MAIMPEWGGGGECSTDHTTRRGGIGIPQPFAKANGHPGLSGIAPHAPASGGFSQTLRGL